MLEPDSVAVDLWVRSRIFMIHLTCTKIAQDRGGALSVDLALLGMFIMVEIYPWCLHSFRDLFFFFYPASLGEGQDLLGLMMWVS